MLSPLAADDDRYDSSPDTERPARRAFPANRNTPVRIPPYPKRARRGFATLPDVTDRQRKVAAIAGGVAMVLALGGFGALLAYAPRDMNSRETAAIQTDSQSVASVASAGAVAPTIKPAATTVAPTAPASAPTSAPKAASSPAADGVAPSETAVAAPAPLQAQAVAAVTAADLRGSAETKAEALVAAEPTAEAGLPVAAFAESSKTAPTEANAAIESVMVPTARPTNAPVVTAAAATAIAAVPSPVAPIAEEPAKATGGTQGTIRSAVNMRISPASGSKVLMVVPTKASVTVIGCKSWCQIDYKGTRGYIYKSFLR